MSSEEDVVHEGSFQMKLRDHVSGMDYRHSDGNDMDSSLWSKLPQDLLFSILARLPLESLARHQAVCRDWRALWQNSTFLHLRSDASSRNSWFIFQRKHQPLTSTMSVDCYNSHTNRWHEFKFDHLPQVQRVCATAGSLLLCVGKIRIGRLPLTQRNGRLDPTYKILDMIVCNPLRPTSWERIPERIGSFVPHVGIVADAHAGDFKVILASLEKTEVYNSRTKGWKLFYNNISPLHDICSSPVEYKGRLLFLGVGPNGQGKVFVYNLEDNMCSSFDNQFSRDPFPRFGYLENCGGRLLMVRVTVSEHQQKRTMNRFFQLRVCEYAHSEEDLNNGVWRELTSIPLLQLESSINANSEEGSRFLAASSSASQNDLLCFTTGMKDGKLDWTNSVQGRAVFLYSLSQNSWCFVGERPEWTHDGVICMRTLQFQPSLQARVGV